MGGRGTLVNSRLSKFADAFIAHAGKELFLTLSEGLIKVRCMETALQLGWTLQEGAGNAPAGPVADYARLKNGSLEWSRAARKIQLGNL